MIRRWTFSIIDCDDLESYVDEEGNKIDYFDAVDFVGTDEEANEESRRRADAWEENGHAFAAKIIRHSMGAVSCK